MIRYCKSQPLSIRPCYSLRELNMIMSEPVMSLMESDALAAQFDTTLSSRDRNDTLTRYKKTMIPHQTAEPNEPAFGR